MILYSNAKINLGLNITSKREDGFHNIETIFLPVDVKDVFEILPNPNSEKNNVIFTCSGLTIAGDDNSNLCIKAYYLLQKHVGNLPSIKMHLHKQIPMGAGLGGGSGNATLVLQHLNQIFNLQLPLENLLQLSLELGSDCPFFLINKPCFAKGRGEVLNPITIPALNNYKIVLVNPGIHVNTKWAFSQIKPTIPTNSLSNLVHQDISTWQNTIVNDFEASVFKQHPAIASIKTILQKTGAVYVSLTGTGSTVFALVPQHYNINECISLFPSDYYIKASSCNGF